jgi:hypothetical protein
LDGEGGSGLVEVSHFMVKGGKQLKEETIIFVCLL